MLSGWLSLLVPLSLPSFSLQIKMDRCYLSMPPASVVRDTQFISQFKLKWKCVPPLEREGVWKTKRQAENKLPPSSLPVVLIPPVRRMMRKKRSVPLSEKYTNTNVHTAQTISVYSVYGDCLNNLLNTVVHVYTHTHPAQHTLFVLCHLNTHQHTLSNPAGVCHTHKHSRGPAPHSPVPLPPLSHRNGTGTGGGGE